MKATLALLLPALVAAYPGYVKCDLTGGQTASDLTVATTIMGGAVVDSAAIAAPSGTTYSANTVLTWTWDQGMLTQGFVKASAGTITGLSGSTARTDCTAPAVAQYTKHARVPTERERTLTPATTPIYPAADTAGITFTWTAPADVSNLATVTFNFFGNTLGYGALNRYSTTLNRASTATVASTAVGTLVTNAATTAAFVTTNLLTTATDVASIKIVASTTTCGAAAGNGDAIAGGTCTLAGSGTSATCSITIAFSVGATTGNHWCYSTAATVSSSAGAFVTLSTPSTVDTTAGSSSSAIASTVGGIAVATVGLVLASLLA